MLPPATEVCYSSFVNVWHTPPPLPLHPAPLQPPPPPIPHPAPPVRIGIDDRSQRERQGAKKARASAELICTEAKD